jgi:hypothetical protein
MILSLLSIIVSQYGAVAWRSAPLKEEFGKT